jgi:hypothetical protein
LPENAVSLPLGSYLPVLSGDLTVANGDVGTTWLDIRLVTGNVQHARKTLSLQSPSGYLSSEFGAFRVGPSDRISVTVTAFASCGTASINNGGIIFIKIAD